MLHRVRLRVLAHARRWGRSHTDLVAGAAPRSFRTLLLLAVLIVFNAFDLAFTHAQMMRGEFCELNLFAAAAASAHGVVGLLAYKVLLFGAGAVILYRCRRHWESEVGAWVLVGCYGALMVWWMAYVHCAELVLADVAIQEMPHLF